MTGTDGGHVALHERTFAVLEGQPGDASDRIQAEELAAHVARSLTTGILVAQEEERKRVARELHDETIQSLSSLLVTLDHVEQQALAESGDTRAGFERLRSIVRRTLDETRAIAQALRPRVLDDLGLAAALEWLADECRRTYGIQIEVEADSKADRHWPPEVEIGFFRVAQEALTNACRHSAAHTVCIQLSVRDEDAELTVWDDGKGFDLDQVCGGARQDCLGTRGMQERAALLGGGLTIASARGDGTRVTLRVPLTADGPDALASQVPVSSPTTETTADIRVVLVDDHAIFREGLAMILDTCPGIVVVGEAADGRRAVEMTEQLQPNVVVMDIAMPNLNGFDATRQIKRRFPDVRVAILTTYESRQYLVKMIDSGAAACVLKRSAGTELVAAIQAIAQGQSYVSPTIAGTMLDDYRVRIDQLGDDMLSEREREVLQLIVEGRSNQEIADHLVLSVKTVQTHRAHILRKLGAHDRADLVKHAISIGMIPPETLEA